MSRILTVGLVAHPCGDDPDANTAATMDGIRRVAAAGAQLVCLQELHRTRYFCQTAQTPIFDLAETIPGPSTAAYGDLARELGVVIVLSLFERRGPGLYHNTAVVLDTDGSIAGTYRKSHIPDDPGYYEKFYFTPGDTGIRPIDTSVGRLGVLICWDQWYPEAARLQALAGAELLIYPTAIGWYPPDDPAEQARQRDAWIAVQRGHAVANAIPTIAVNRVGHEPDPAGGPGAQFWGSSFVFGCQGEPLYQADTTSPIADVVTLDLDRTDTVRRIWPFLRDRRIDLYADLTKRYRD